MPYKSEAQRRMFHYLESKGKIPKSTVHEFDQASKGMDLPERKASGGRAADFPMSVRDGTMGMSDGGYVRPGHDVRNGIREMIEYRPVSFRGNEEYRSFADEGRLNEIIPGMSYGGRVAFGGSPTPDAAASHGKEEQPRAVGMGSPKIHHGHQVQPHYAGGGYAGHTPKHVQMLAYGGMAHGGYSPRALSEAREKSMKVPKMAGGGMMFAKALKHRGY